MVHLPRAAALVLALVPSARSTGCYTGPPGHECLCSLTNATCVNHFAPGIWTNQCCKALPPPSPPLSPPPCHADQGCYDQHTTHTCDCRVSKSQCAAVDGLWTTGCGCDHEGDPGHEPCNTTTESYGCYNAGGHHRCDCSSSQAACVEAGGSWLNGCSCGVHEESPPPAPAPPPLPMHGGRVLVQVEAECPAEIYLSGSFVYSGLLVSMASLTGVARDFISVSVMDHCTSGTKGAAYALIDLTVSCATTQHVELIEKQLSKALDDAESASFLLDIAVIRTPKVTAECHGCGVSKREVAAAVIGALVASAVVGAAVYLAMRKHNRRRAGGLLAGAPSSTDPMPNPTPGLPAISAIGS